MIYIYEKLEINAFMFEHAASHVSTGNFPKLKAV